MKKFYIKTLGCKTNQIESNLIAEHLSGKGYVQCNNINDAQIFILNSCSVTSNADSEALRLLKKAKKDNPNIYSVLTGCMAQLESENLKQYEFIDLVLGNSEKLHIEDYLQPIEKVNVSDIFEQDKFLYKKVVNPSKTRAYLKVQDGCNNRCTYCTIWKARGKSRSASLAQIQEQISTYVEHGFKEVVVTGIHIGQWGGDLQPKYKFLDMIKAIEDTEIARYRLGSLDPFELNDELIDYLSVSEKFCPHFHMSLQSACNDVLKSMNRHYTVEKYLAQIEQINEKFNLPFIGSDIIVGFPGETEEQFETTYENIARSGLTMAHIFPYSIRKDTVAANMPDQISKQVKSERLNKLKSLVNNKYENFLNRNIGTVQNVIFQKKKCSKTGMFKGISGNYLTVYAQSDVDLGSQMLDCRIEEIKNGLIIAKPVL